MIKNRVYLAGPITGLNYKGATDWRNSFTQKLKDTCDCVSPMRAKYYLEALNEIPAEGCEAYGIISGGPAILARDFHDVVSSELLVVNLLEAKRISIGTILEIGWAYQNHIPTIIIWEEDNIHKHSMLTAMPGYKVSSIEEALTICRGFFSNN